MKLLDSIEFKLNEPELIVIPGHVNKFVPYNIQITGLEPSEIIMHIERGLGGSTHIDQIPFARFRTKFSKDDDTYILDTEPIGVFQIYTATDVTIHFTSLHDNYAEIKVYYSLLIDRTATV